MQFIGIDPGKTGAVAIINEFRQGVVIPMPPTERDQRDLFAGIVKEYVGDERPPKRAIFGMEWEHAFPLRGVASTWTFACHYGFLRGVLTGLDIPYEEIGVSAWMKASHLAKKVSQKPGSKAHIMARAKLWFPTFGITARNADAVLIAEYMRRTWAREPDETDDPPEPISGA